MGTAFILDATGQGNYGAKVDASGALFVAGSILTMPTWAGIGSVFIANGSISISTVPSTATTGSVGTILSGINTNVLTQVIGGSALIYGWSATSTADSQITLTKDSTRLQTKRINIFSERNVSEQFISPIIVSAGSLYIQAVHGETTSQSFEASLFVHII